jgi:hypothetical protein
VSDDARRRVCEELARTLATEEGLRQARLLQALDLALPWGPSAGAGAAAEKPSPGSAAEKLAAAREAAARALRPKAAPAPVAIGPWRPQTSDGALSFVRAEPPGLGDPWPPHEVLRPKPPDGPRRVVFLGESAAAGWFYAPQLTPALVLERQLRSAAGEGSWEVVNLAKVDLSAPELMALLGAVHQLRPDAVVVFAGNNWPQRYQVPPPGAPGPAEAALAFRGEGLAGLERISHEGTARLAEEILARLARFAGEASVPVTLVVPEVNLADFDRTAAAAWLPGGDLAAWYAAADEARGRLDQGDLAGAEQSARRMIALDGGRTAGAQRLLSRALEAQGRAPEAAAAARAEVDARAWDNHPFVPAATTAVQGALRERGAAHGFRVVDLPRLFAEHGGSPLPGRRYFLDYCHLTPEGMAVSMAAVAAGILGDGAPGSDLVRPEHYAAPAGLEARARFMAALYTRHWIATDAPAPAFTHWIEAALEASPDVADVMRGYLATRCEPPAALMFSTRQQELFGSVGRSERHIWSAPHLDPHAVREIGAALDRRGAGVSGEIEDALVRHHAVRDRPFDLLRAAYQWGLTDQPRANSSLRNNPPAFYAARTPRSHFTLVAEAARALTLEVAARLPVVERPRAGELSVLVEGQPAALLALTGAWQRHVIELPAALLRRGINRLTLEWPPLPPEGDAALARIGRRLDQRVGVDIHPVFGELMTLSARRAASA